MPWLRFACPCCRSEFAAEGPPQGGQIRCPACGQVVSLPGQPADTGEWFYAHERRKLGPFSWEQIRQLAASGRVGAADMVLRKGAARWVPAEQVPGLLPAPVAMPVAAAARPRHGPRRLWLIAGGAAGLALLLIVLGVMQLLRSPSPQVEPAAPAQRAEQPVKRGPPAPPPADSEGTAKKSEKPAPATAGDLLARALERLNAGRRLAGLQPVRLDEALSKGCQAHAVYLVKNPDLLTAAGQDEAGEDPGRPGFSEDGRRAALASMILPADPPRAIDIAMARLFSRVPLLEPGLRAVGLGAARDEQGWVCVLGVAGGTEGEGAVVYPAAGQQGVPLFYSGGPEVPRSETGQKPRAGFPVTVTFPPHTSVRGGSVVLRDPAGATVEALVFTPEKPAPGGPHNTLSLVAAAPLRPDTAYRVTAEAEVDGRPWRKSWQFTTANDAALARQAAAKAVDLVNAYRRQAGLAAVRLDAALSRGCSAHAAYVARNIDHPSTQGLGGHEERPDLPGFTEAGRRAGRAAVIAMGDHDPLLAVRGWMATLYHRLPLLQPGLRRVGFGMARSADGHGWVTVLDVHSGKEPTAPKDGILYPADGQAGVPLAFSGPEYPDPIPESKDGRAGYPITATFPGREALVGVTGTLTDAAGREVPAWVSSPERPANPRYAGHQGTTVGLIAREPLRPATTYHVHLTGRKGPGAWARAWSFKTGEDDREALAAEVVASINRCRADAGLAPVRLDAELSAGCAAHARYVERNRQEPALQGAGLHDEAPKLPGYSAAGREAARRSDVHLDATLPTAQVDDLMGTTFRRAALLDPRLRRVGFGSADGGRGRVYVLDLIRGRGDDPVLYPADGQRAVPLTGLDRPPGDRAAPAGFPITVTFPAAVAVRQVRGTLRDAEGREVGVWLTDPEHPANPALQRQTVCLVPRRPLRPGTTYEVTVSASAGGRPWRRSWHFTTLAE
jgi:uncharacterized protein YkwD